MDIFACCRKAIEDDAYDKATFSLGREGYNAIDCQWLDAHFDMFFIIGNEGFIRTNQVPEGMVCTNYNPNKGEV